MSWGARLKLTDIPTSQEQEQLKISLITNKLDLSSPQNIQKLEFMLRAENGDAFFTELNMTPEDLRKKRAEWAKCIHNNHLNVQDFPQTVAWFNQHAPAPTAPGPSILAPAQRQPYPNPMQQHGLRPTVPAMNPARPSAPQGYRPFSPFVQQQQAALDSAVGGMSVGGPPQHQWHYPHIYPAPNALANFRPRAPHGYYGQGSHAYDPMPSVGGWMAQDNPPMAPLANPQFRVKVDEYEKAIKESWETYIAEEEKRLAQQQQQQGAENSLAFLGATSTPLKKPDPSPNNDQ